MAIALSSVLAFLLGLPLLKSTVAFSAVVSISTIGLYISYAIPIFCRSMYARKNFERGPFHLGRWSTVVGWVAVLWVAFITARPSAVRHFGSEMYMRPYQKPGSNLQIFQIISRASSGIGMRCWRLTSCGPMHLRQAPALTCPNMATLMP